MRSGEGVLGAVLRVTERGKPEIGVAMEGAQRGLIIAGVVPPVCVRLRGYRGCE